VSDTNGDQSEIHWRFSQIKGIIEEQPTDVDLISCVEFSDEGEFLATGDKGGRVVIFQRNQVSTSIHGKFNFNFRHGITRVSGPANSTFIQHFNLMSRNSTTSSRWRSKRKLTKSNG
jgi:hypothetical protein